MGRVPWIHQVDRGFDYGEITGTAFGIFDERFIVSTALGRVQPQRGQGVSQHDRLSLGPLLELLGVLFENLIIPFN